MAEKLSPGRFAAKPSDIAEELLEPVLAFLVQAGISEAEASKAFHSAWKRSNRKQSAPVSLESLDNPQPYVDLVTSWSRHSEYLGKDGLPRDLTIRGVRGFSSLVRMVAPGLNPRKALLLLQAYGNVERLPNGRVRLTKPFFHIKSDGRLAFEPSVRFLLDAARNVKGSLQDPTVKRRAIAEAQNFWRTVDSNSLPPSRRKAFLAFSRTLSLTFLQDVDDWLAENARPSRRRTKLARVGLGLFTIGTAPE